MGKLDKREKMVSSTNIMWQLCYDAYLVNLCLKLWLVLGVSWVGWSG